MRDFYKGVVLLLAVLLSFQAYAFAELVDTKTMGMSETQSFTCPVCYVAVTPWFQNCVGTRHGNHHVAIVVSGARREVECRSPF